MSTILCLSGLMSGGALAATPSALHAVIDAVTAAGAHNVHSIVETAAYRCPDCFEFAVLAQLRGTDVQMKVSTFGDQLNEHPNRPIDATVTETLPISKK